MRGYKFLLGIAGLLLLVFVVYQASKPAATNWKQTFSPKDRIPFGTYIFDQQLSHLFSGAKISRSTRDVYNTFRNQSYQNSAYVIVAGRLELTKTDWPYLKKYLESGNAVFIAAYDFGGVLESKLKLETAFRLGDAAGGSNIPVNFTNPGLKRSTNFVFDKSIGAQYFSKVDTARAIALGKDYLGNVNFVKYPFKKGALYLLPDPSFFSNYQLLKPEGADYASRALAYLSPAKHILADQYFTIGNQNNESPLRFIFGNDALRYAYYLACTAVALFVLFEIKRRQRVIPVEDPMLNATVEFTRVVGSVYYHEADHLDIARKRLTYLQDYVRTRYFIDKNDFSAEVLQEKTGARPATAKLLVRYIAEVQESDSLSEGQLHTINDLIEQFYKQIKK